MVEFYAIDTVTHTLMNVTEAWKKLTENGQDYEILHYHVVQVEMKGQFFIMIIIIRNYVIIPYMANVTHSELYP